MTLKDPTRAQMLECLHRLEPEADELDIEAAIYWFAHDYQGGQTSSLYEALCSSPFHPSLLHHSVEDEGETASMLYALLESM